VVKQINGHYKTKVAKLKDLKKRVGDLVSKFGLVIFREPAAGGPPHKQGGQAAQHAARRDDTERVYKLNSKYIKWRPVVSDAGGERG
jgi:hypothetical protein